MYLFMMTPNIDSDMNVVINRKSDKLLMWLGCLCMQPVDLIAVI